MTSLSYPETKVTNPSNVNYLQVDKNWIKGFHQEVEFKIEYQHSIRAASILLETEKSKKKAPDKNLFFLQITEQQDTDTDTVKVFLDTKELG